MKCALASHLRQGIVYCQGVSEKNYDSFVREVQSLAKELESIPSFREIRGSDKESFLDKRTTQATLTSLDRDSDIFQPNQS